MGRVFLVSKEVRAETAEQARRAYFALWRAGLVEAVGYDMVNYGIVELPESEVKSDVES